MASLWPKIGSRTTWNRFEDAPARSGCYLHPDAIGMGDER